MNRRILGLILAVILAGVATFFLIQYVTSADERAREDEVLAEVFIAQGDIPAGTAASEAAAQGLIATDQIPARTVPDGAIGDLSQIDGLVATGPIFTGEVILGPRFGQTVAQSGIGLSIPDGLQAVTVDAGVVEGVAGFVQPQDDVSILATIVVPEPAEEEVEDAEPEAVEDGVEPVEATFGLRTQFIVQNVRVLAVGQRVVNTEAEGQPSSIQLSNDRYLFTLAMDPQDIERLIFAYQEGLLHFTILPELPDEEVRDLVETPGRTVEDLFED